MGSTSITMNTSGKSIKVLLMIAFMLASCQAVPATSSLQPTATLTALPVTVTPTISKKTVTMTLRPSFTPVNTRIPTLSSEQQMTQVSDLLTNNGGCELPCWWGIVPGETSWETAEKILIPLASEYFVREKEGSGVYEFNFYFFDLPKEITEGFLSLTLTVENNVITNIIADGFEGISSYKITELLVKYGKPDEVRLLTFTGYIDTPPPVMLVLFYKSIGIYAEYETTGKIKEGLIKACFSKNGYLVLWDKNDDVTFLDIWKRFYRAVEDECLYKNLDEVTSVTIDDFYRIFTTGDSCLETTEEIWPMFSP